MKKLSGKTAHVPLEKENGKGAVQIEQGKKVKDLESQVGELQIVLESFQSDNLKLKSENSTLRVENDRLSSEFSLFKTSFESLKKVQLDSLAEPLSPSDSTSILNTSPNLETEKELFQLKEEVSRLQASQEQTAAALSVASKANAEKELETQTLRAEMTCLKIANDKAFPIGGFHSSSFFFPSLSSSLWMRARR